MAKPRIYIESSPLIDVIKGRVKIALTPEREKDLWLTEQCLRAALDGIEQILKPIPEKLKN